MTDQKVEWAWTDARELGVRGRPFEDAGRFYSRLPARAEGVVEPAVWNLAQQSTGLRVEFVTDSTRVAARVAYLEGSSGGNDLRSSSLDLYVERDGRTGWVASGPKPQAAEWEAELRRGLPAGRARYTLYLPHGAAIEQLAVGVEPGATLEPAPLSDHKPLCFYGTSIVHGFNASRPGMTYPAILGRRLAPPVPEHGVQRQRADAAGGGRVPRGAGPVRLRRRLPGEHVAGRHRAAHAGPGARAAGRAPGDADCPDGEHRLPGHLHAGGPARRLGPEERSACARPASSCSPRAWPACTTSRATACWARTARPPWTARTRRTWASSAWRTPWSRFCASWYDGSGRREPDAPSTPGGMR